MGYGFIILPLCGMIVCLSVAWIIKIREKRPGASVIYTREQDFIEKWLGNFQNRLGSYGGKMTVNTYIAIGIMAYIGMIIVLLMLGQSIWVSMGVGLIGFWLPDLVLRFYSKRLRKQFEDRYARALQQFSSSLRSGLTIQQAVTDICECVFIHDSIRASFRQIDTDLKVGLSVKESFLRAAHKLNSEDALDVALAISLQNELGGNEARVVETIARNISGRILLRREIKSLFADTNITILMMDFVPMFIIIGLIFGSPQYIAPFFSSFEMTALFIAIAVFTLIGSFVIRRVVKKGTGG